MKLFTYRGETPAEALNKAQMEHGDAALLINSNEIRKKSLNTPAIYEIVIAVDDSVKKSEIELREEGQGGDGNEQKQNSVAKRLQDIAEKEKQKRQKIKNPYSVEDVSLQLSDAVQQISRIAGVESSIAKKIRPQAPVQTSTPNKEPLSKTSQSETKQHVPQEETKELRLIKSELDKLNDKIKLIQNMFWEEKGPKKDGLIIPHEFAEIYRLAKTSGMYKDHLDKIMQLSLEFMPLKMREKSLLIKRYFREILRKMVHTRIENENSGVTKIMMLVGPTGVGKTTTLAKIAARYSMKMNKKNKVGIITLDTYRIGAVDQLMFYAKKMRLSIDTVVDPPEFATAINSLKHCDYILIDTVGSSQHDKQKIDSLKSFLNSELHASVDVNLVISANTKYEDLRDIYQTYSILNIDTIIVTKLDETRGFGNIFSLVYETKKPLSYFSIGQEVPDDLMPAKSDYLVDCLLDGFRRDRS